ncbi:MAG: enoyl-CoA hydratase/isomerase family protein [Candidatus Bathyarchaeia archaeon]
MQFKDIIYEKNENFAKILINRPQVLNALNDNVKQELNTALEEAERDTTIRCVVITGSGERAFSAGADITELQRLTPASALEFSKKGLNEVIRTIEYMSKPVIAAVNGFALGGGCELVMGCDIILAADNAKFGQPEIKIGIIPGAGGSQRFPRLLGLKKANSLLFTGDMIDAKEAESLGLVSKTVPAGALEEAVREMVAKISALSPITVTITKKAVNDGMKTDLDSAINIEGDLFSLCFATNDQKEGMKAFLEKRQPKWSGQ